MKFNLIPERFRYYMSDDAIQVSKIDINIDLPSDLDEETLRGQAIQTLLDKQERVIAEAHQRKLELQEKINNLKRLSYDANPEPLDNVISDVPF